MALAKAIKRRMISGNSKRTIVDLTCDAAYPAGGYPVIPADFELATLDNVDIGASSGGFLGSFDQVNSKIKIFKTGAALSGALAEIAAGDVNGQIFRVEAVGNIATGG